MENRNPYEYNGALDLKKDQMVCLSRVEQVEKAFHGIAWGDFQTIIAPRQLGKTTFIRQLEKRFPEGYFPVYFDIAGVIPGAHNKLYEWFMKKITEQVPFHSSIKKSVRFPQTDPHIHFLQFLESFQAADEVNKIVLFFDEVEGIEHKREFFRLWRDVCHKRSTESKNNLKKISVVMTASVDLIGLTYSFNSPYDISQVIFLKDFTPEESEKLILEPMKSVGVEIHTIAKNRLIKYCNGHPQLLQHMCYNLVEIARKKKRMITVNDIYDTVEVLFQESHNLSHLTLDLNRFSPLHDLVKNILNGDDISFERNRAFSFEGVGPVINDGGGFCKIRNEIYRSYLLELLEISKTANRENEIPSGAVLGQINVVAEKNDSRLAQDVIHRLHKEQLRCKSFLWEKSVEVGHSWFKDFSAALETTDIILLIISGDKPPVELGENMLIHLRITQMMEKGVKLFVIFTGLCSVDEQHWLYRQAKDPCAHEFLNKPENLEKAVQSIHTLLQAKMNGSNKGK